MKEVSVAVLVLARTGAALAGDATPAYPPGPYATWTSEQQADARKAAFRDCLLPTLLQFEQYTGPAEARKNGGQALALACIVYKMPADWPDRATTLSEASAHYEVARRLDPDFPPDPKWLHLPVVHTP